MKKLFIFMGALLLGVGAFGVAGKKAVRAGADDATDLQALLRSYNVDGYTKKTQMYLTEDAVDELATYFHHGQNTLQRATYYNAAETALLMGNYDGTFGGAGGINGGFRNNGSVVSCERFHYNDAVPNPANFFDDDHITVDYVAQGQTVGSYYQTLQSLSEAVVSGQWVKSDGAYIYNVSDLHLTDGEYDDPVLKKFQYFAAPMMKQNMYFAWHTIRVVEGASFLSIRLYTTAANGEGKSTLVGASEALVSEARVYKGINLHHEVTWTLKGSFDSWSDGRALSLQSDLYFPEQYAITTTLSSNDQLKFNCGDIYLGFDQIENQDWFFRWNSEDASNNNIMVKLTGEYTFYLKPKAGTVYAMVPANGYIDIPLDLSSDWKSANAVTYAYVWNEGGDQWFRANNEGTSVRITGLYNNLILVRKNPVNDSGDWDGKWNQTSDLTIEHLKTLKVEGYGSASWVSAS